MTLVVDALPEGARRRLEILTLLLTLFICAVLAYYAGAQAYRAWQYDDVTMTPPYFKTWPSAAAVPVGFTLCALRIYLQLLKRISPARFPFAEKHAPGAHGEE
jgi:TRAP-type C4-dicarboxylate transport system permease small subunit